MKIEGGSPTPESESGGFRPQNERRSLRFSLKGALIGAAAGAVALSVIVTTCSAPDYMFVPADKIAEFNQMFLTQTVPTTAAVGAALGGVLGGFYPS